ncbi:threonylcarbamoyl-AMP synthase [Candidatus Woesebacteria bacterium]|nr:threonylcarbamoyl-AMP synthase [Candidatus Woesebacteria bacterium]
MKIVKKLNSLKVFESLKESGVVVIPTDTIYGVVGLASSKKALGGIYELKGRDKSKPFIVLISSIEDLGLLEIKLDENQKNLVEKYWPGKVSIVFPRAHDTLAVRLPDYPELRELIKKTGPLIAPSANTEGKPPAKNVKEAINYFGDKIDYYVDGGEINSEPSTLIKLEYGKVVVLREGAVKIEESDKAS